MSATKRRAVAFPNVQIFRLNLALNRVRLFALRIGHGISMMTKQNQYEPRSAAINLCATLLLSKAAKGRKAMTVGELVDAAKVPWVNATAGISWALQQNWLRRRNDKLELSAAGIYVAKEALDLPR